MYYLDTFIPIIPLMVSYIHHISMSILNLNFPWVHLQAQNLYYTTVGPSKTPAQLEDHPYFIFYLLSCFSAFEILSSFISIFLAYHLIFKHNSSTHKVVFGFHSDFPIFYCKNQSFLQSRAYHYYYYLF